MLKGVIYARYSCDKQTDNSIRGQIRECTVFAERNDIQIINTYCDEAISGRTDKRPAFLKMFRDANQHMFDVIIVWKGDRFSRNRADAAKYKNELKKLNIKLLSATEANVTGPEAILMDGINEAFAEFYSVELAEKVNRGLMQNVLEGRFTGGVIITGYKLNENHKIIIDEPKAKVVKDIFEMYANSDISIHDLVKELNKLGHKNNGKDFTYPSLLRLLENRKYIGEFKFKDQINYTTYLPIIEESLFIKVQEKMKRNKRDGARYRAKEKYLLTGKLFCGECGGSMKAYAGISGNGKRELHRYYKCGGSRSVNEYRKVRYCKKELEKAVVDLLVEYVTKDLNPQKVSEDITKSLNKVSPELERLTNSLQETEKAIKNLNYALEKGLNLDDTIERLKELGANKTAYKEEIERIKKQQYILNPEKVEIYINQMIHRDYTKDENVMYLLNVLVHKVILYKDGRFVIILNSCGDDDPTKLESTVRALVCQDHHIK